jgi:hypothetical protein
MTGGERDLFGLTVEAADRVRAAAGLDDFPHDTRERHHHGKLQV